MIHMQFCNTKAAVHFKGASFHPSLDSECHGGLGIDLLLSRSLSYVWYVSGNVFIHCNPKFNNPESGLEEDIGTEDEQDDSEPVTYKIGM